MSALELSPTSATASVAPQTARTRAALDRQSHHRARQVPHSRAASAAFPLHAAPPVHIPGGVRSVGAGPAVLRGRCVTPVRSRPDGCTQGSTPQTSHTRDFVQSPPLLTARSVGSVEATPVAAAAEPAPTDATAADALPALLPSPVSPPEVRDTDTQSGSNRGSKDQRSTRSGSVASDGRPPLRVAEDRLRRVFDKMDRNGNGYLRRADVIASLRGRRPSDAEVSTLLGLPLGRVREGPTRDLFEAVFQSIDADGSREISWAEFRAYLLPQMLAQTLAELRRAEDRAAEAEAQRSASASRASVATGEGTPGRRSSEAAECAADAAAEARAAAEEAAAAAKALDKREEALRRREAAVVAAERAAVSAAAAAAKARQKARTEDCSQHASFATSGGSRAQPVSPSSRSNPEHHIVSAGADREPSHPSSAGLCVASADPHPAIDPAALGLRERALRAGETALRGREQALCDRERALHRAEQLLLAAEGPQEGAAGAAGPPQEAELTARAEVAEVEAAVLRHELQDSDAVGSSLVQAVRDCWDAVETIAKVSRDRRDTPDSPEAAEAAPDIDSIRDRWAAVESIARMAYGRGDAPTGSDAAPDVREEAHGPGDDATMPLEFC